MAVPPHRAGELPARIDLRVPAEREQRGVVHGLRRVVEMPDQCVGGRVEPREPGSVRAAAARSSSDS